MGWLSSLFNPAKSVGKYNQVASGQLGAAGTASNALYAPYRAGGQGAYNTLQGAYGLGDKAAQDKARGAFQTSPGYEFQMQQGVDAIDHSAAARGNLNSGSTLKALTQFGQGTANQEYQQWLAGVKGQSDTGYNATSATSDAGLGVASGQANLTSAIGQAKASQGAAQLGLIGNLIGSAVKAAATVAASDRSLKTDVQEMGKDETSGLMTYAFRYKGDAKSGAKTVGYMAQDVKKKYPDAVRKVGNKLAILPDRIPGGMPA